MSEEQIKCLIGDFCRFPKDFDVKPRLSHLSYAQLSSLCKIFGLPRSGNKDLLLEKVTAYLKSPEPLPVKEEPQLSSEEILGSVDVSDSASEAHIHVPAKRKYSCSECKIQGHGKLNCPERSNKN